MDSTQDLLDDGIETYVSSEGSCPPDMEKTSKYKIYMVHKKL